MNQTDFWHWASYLKPVKISNQWSGVLSTNKVQEKWVHQHEWCSVLWNMYIALYWYPCCVEVAVTFRGEPTLCNWLALVRVWLVFLFFFAVSKRLRTRHQSPSPQHLHRTPCLWVAQNSSGRYVAENAECLLYFLCLKARHGNSHFLYTKKQNEDL